MCVSVLSMIVSEERLVCSDIYQRLCVCFCTIHDRQWREVVCFCTIHDRQWREVGLQ